jgi:lipoyl(octanoyl) transferase
VPPHTPALPRYTTPVRDTTKAIQVARPGRVPYAEGLRLQEEAHARVRAGGAESLLLLEHPPTITLGRSTQPEHLLLTREALAERGIEVHEVARGGSVTYHGPGQLVGYPILDLRGRGIGLHEYLRLLEEGLIHALDRLGLEAFQREGLTGVWTAGGKVAAIGVAVRAGVSLHGFCLNIAVGPEPYRLIQPCGLAEPVTDLRALGCQATWDEVVEAAEEGVLQHLARDARAPGTSG